MLRFKKQEKKEQVDKATEQRLAASTDVKGKEEKRSSRDRSRSPQRKPRSPDTSNRRSRRHESPSPSRRHDRSSKRRTSRSRSPSPRRRRQERSRSRSPIKRKKPSTEKKKPSLAYKLIEIEINDRLGKKVRVKCSPKDTVGDFKKLAAAQIGTDPQKIVLKKWYKEFKDHITLDDYELHDGMNVELYYR